MKPIYPLILLMVITSCTNQPETPKQIPKMEEVDISNLEKSSEMLDEEKYWAIVSTSLHNSADQSRQEEILINEIAKLTPREMIGFRLRTDKLLYDTYNSAMWCAGYIMNGGCSDDGFEYFRNWVISRGKETYYAAKENPDNLIREVSDGQDEYEFESFWYVSLEAFKRTTGKNLYDYVDYDTFKTCEGNYPRLEFNWAEDKPETMRVICPGLFGKLWKH